VGGRFRDFEHVLRVLALFALGVLAFVVLRAVFIPRDFGTYGYFRAGALEDNRARVPVYAGRATCGECHADIVEARRGSRHETIGCEACHGPLARHVSGDDTTAPARPDPRTTCVRCHATKAGKPAAYPQVDPGDHAPEGPCTECHKPHHPGMS
jgi:hypothetical protein